MLKLYHRVNILGTFGLASLGLNILYYLNICSSLGVAWATSKLLVYFFVRHSVILLTEVRNYNKSYNKQY